MKQKKRQLLSIAYHEAGHAVAHYLLRFRFRRVSIIHDVERGNLGHVLAYKKSQKTLELDEQCAEFSSLADGRMIARRHELVVCLLAGMEAERHFMPGSKFRSSARQDVRVAKQILRRLHPEDEAQLVYGWLVLRARHLVVDDSFARIGIEALAQALIEKREMSGKEARRVIEEAIFTPRAR
jgi:hypothetical protein